MEVAAAGDSVERETGVGGVARAGDASSGAAVGDFARLESAIRALVRSHALVKAENHALRGQLDARERQIAELELAASEVEGRRKRAIDRLDALIAEVEALESRCGEDIAAAETKSAAPRASGAAAGLNAPGGVGA